MRDTALYAAAVVLFAALVTTHVATIVGLARRIHPARAALAFLVFPLAPLFALKEHMKARFGLWTFFFAAYAVALFLSRR